MRRWITGKRWERRVRRAEIAGWRRPSSRLGQARTSRIVLVAVFGLSVGGFPASAQSNTLEYAVKAAYLFKFTPFVEWPASAFTAPNSPFNVCVLGGDPFGGLLDQTVGGHQVGEHPVRVLRPQTADAAGVCHILYVGGARPPVAAAALSKLRGSPILTVTEQTLGVSGGVVQFLVKDGHVRFTIDANAAAANRMTISAKLLSLAASVGNGS